MGFTTNPLLIKNQFLSDTSLLNRKGAKCAKENKMETKKEQIRKPGVCIPWEEKKKELGEIKGDPEMVKKMWEQNDCNGYYFIWQCFLW